MKLTYSLILFWCLVLHSGCNTTEVEPAAGSSATYSNPILAGFNPDPSICKVGSDYYLVTSSFAYFPGIPILHSKDLVHWNQIGSAITRTGQMDFTTQGFSRGLFAPTIEYHDGWYYITCTQVDIGGNFIVKSRSPEGPYSNPYWLPEVNGIDPSLFFDDDGKLYIIYNSIPPNNESLYGGHRTIRMWELDPDSLTVKGEEQLLVNGGTDLSKEPVWIEAPHMYQIDGLYYLMCAEGGTAEAHSEVIFRSERITGPFEVFEGNPILTQRHLDPGREAPITCAGHADMVQTDAGEWWAVFLACRPYRGNHYNTGRETFLAPVTWEEGWPIINPDYEEVQYEYPVPATTGQTVAEVPLNGKFDHEFDLSKPLDHRWLFLRNTVEEWYEHNTTDGTLTLQLRPEAIDTAGNPSLILRRQSHLRGEAVTRLTFTPQRESEMAGLVILQNAEHYYFINKAADQLQLLKQTDDGHETLAEAPYTGESVYLKIEADGPQYHFSFSPDNTKFKVLAENVDATHLSTKTAGGFVGCLYGMYATSNGGESGNRAVFDYFRVASR